MSRTGLTPRPRHSRIRRRRRHPCHRSEGAAAVPATARTGAADVTVTVPSFSTIPGRPYVLIKGDNGIGKIILDAFGAELINGSGLFNGSVGPGGQYKRIELSNDGAADYAKEF